MIFASLNEEIHRQSYNVFIQRLETSFIHWKSSIYIDRQIQDLELALLKSNNWDSADFISWLLELNQQNPRIEECKFFVDPAYPQTLVCVCVSDVPTFKPHWLERNIIVNFKKLQRVLWITDVTLQEWEDRSLSLPRQWIPQSRLGFKYDSHKRLFLV